MRQSPTLILTSILFITQLSISKVHATTSHTMQTDTIINPPAVSAQEGKVSISSGDNGIEFTPLSNQHSGAVIQPVNKATGKGISTSFYLPDSSDWKFYTNQQERLKISGSGDIITNSTLLVNKAAPDNSVAMRVNGIARFDSAINLQGADDSNSFISINRNIENIRLKTEEGYAPYTTTPTYWNNGKNIPVFRLRHPSNKDFMILPYEYGTAIEYNGVVECWVGEWSIHRGLSYQDVEGKGNGWGGVMWVGDDDDTGGLRATARDNRNIGGNVKYGELSVERFTGLPLGDMRFRLPSTEHAYQFVYGERGSTNIVAKVSDKGFFLPKVSSVAAIVHPEKAQLVYDSTDNQLKSFNGQNWVTLSDNGKTGASTLSANGLAIVVRIAHSLQSKPSYFNVLAASEDAANILYVTADAEYLNVFYKAAPLAGTNNLSYNWQVKP